MKIRDCPNCGAEFEDVCPSKKVKCPNCRHLVLPKTGLPYKLRKSLECNPSRQCVCCGARGSKEVQVGQDYHLLCVVCHDFSHPFVASRELFTRYRESGGAACWIMAGKRALLDGVAVGTVEDVRDRDVPRLKDLRRRPGSFQGGVPFGKKLGKGGNLEEDAEAQVTVNMIGVYLKRRMSLNGVCRELRRTNRRNKHGKVSWNPSTIRFIAEREGWI